MVDLGRLFHRGQDILAESNRLIARQTIAFQYEGTT